MSDFENAERELLVRFYQWSRSDAEREVKAGFPFLHGIQSATVVVFLKYMSRFSADRQLETLLALVKRAHREAATRSDGELTEKETRLVDKYISFQLTYPGLDVEEDLIRYWVPRRAAGLPVRTKLNKRKFSRRVAEELKPLFTGFTERHGTEDLFYERPGDNWTLQTMLHVGRPPYYFQTIRADWREVLKTSITSWLGIGHGAWDLLYEDQSEGAAKTIALLCAHFMNAVPELLDGLVYDKATLLVPRA
jgi:hypothetical protein